MRRYIRHPLDIPIEYNVVHQNVKNTDYTKDIAIGGLCFRTKDHIETGQELSIRIPAMLPNFTVRGKVVWCTPRSDCVEVGIQFSNPEDVYRTRVVEQVCYIKQYQKDIHKKEGRQLSDEQAAEEWISKYANTFPA